MNYFIRQTTTTHTPPFCVACKLSKTMDGTTLSIHKISINSSLISACLFQKNTHNRNGGPRPSSLRCQQQNPPSLLGMQQKVDTNRRGSLSNRQSVACKPVPQCLWAGETERCCLCELAGSTSYYILAQDGNRFGAWGPTQFSHSNQSHHLNIPT